jgi:hypothetical protein
MNSKDLARYLVLGGVVAGLSAGTQLRAQSINLNDHNAQQVDTTKKAADKTADKHACKGMNACGGKGNCKSGDKGCAGKNSCKGKGGCASKEYQHSCSGKNACKGQGPDGKNDCKGKGACAVPPAPPAATAS